jgi:16S rRNA (guanine527-N7)-methyltransferase
VAEAIRAELPAPAASELCAVPVQAPTEGFQSRAVRVAAEFSLELKPEVTDRLLAYCTLVVTWNQRVDLTAARNPDELVDLLFADAFAIASAHAMLQGERWLDVGSGAGAPGIPLSLVLPLRMTLLEPREKRVAFLRTAVGSLARPDIAVQRARSDSLGAAICEVAVSRATLPPAEWLAEGARLASRSVWLLLAKAELPELAGRRILHDLRYRWPLTGVDRRAVCVSAKADPLDAQKTSEPSATQTR